MIIRPKVRGPSTENVLGLFLSEILKKGGNLELNERRQMEEKCEISFSRSKRFQKKELPQISNFSLVQEKKEKKGSLIF
jgi:hypothetical protein